ncbi:MAG: alpha/beta hydrolase [Pseudomonadota bacterium]
MANPATATQSAPAENDDLIRRDITFTSRDGLRLYAHAVEPKRQSQHTVLCLPGLTRNSRDFTSLAETLARRGHRVISVDYRGRGRSDHDSDWRNYSPFIEALDITDLAAREHEAAVHIVGTSRGGLIAMILAALRPTMMLSVVLNDIGPRIEPDGLARIIGYVGRIPAPLDWNDAARTVADINSRDFPAVSAEEWGVLARQWFNDSHGRPIAGYDPALARALTASRAMIPEMWPQFRALGKFPILVIRGENSDLLSAETVAKMCRLHPDPRAIEVPGEGHAPLLRDALSQSAIGDFLGDVDRKLGVGRAH